MIRISAEEIRERALRVQQQVPDLEIVAGKSVAGGGSTPEQSLPTWLLAISGDAVETERRLRSQGVIGRIENGRVLLDLRTVSPDEEAKLVATLKKH